MKGIVHIAGAGAVYADAGLVAGFKRGIGPLPGIGVHRVAARSRQSRNLVATVSPPAVTRGIARAVEPKIVVGGNLAPGHQQLQGQMRHIGQALAQGAPDIFVFLTFRINHAGKKHFFKALGHFLRRPFAQGSALTRGLGQLALAAGNLPQQTQKSRAASGEGFALKAGFFFDHALFDHVGRKNLKIRGLKAKVAFAGQQGAAIGRNMIGVGIAFKKLGKPAGRGQFHFALRQFPHVHDRYLDSQILTGFFVRLKQTHGVFAPQVCCVQRPKPGQQARGIQARFPTVGQEQPQAPTGLFSDQGNLYGIAFQIFHHATRRRVAYTIRHARSFRKTRARSPIDHRACSQRHSFIFGLLASVAGAGALPILDAGAVNRYISGLRQQFLPRGHRATGRTPNEQHYSPNWRQPYPGHAGAGKTAALP